MKKALTRSPAAFSLVELSVVIIVISILLAGALSVLTSSVGNKKIEITQKRIQKIYQGMGIFLAKNGRLPCPAAINLAKSDSNYGLEGDCTITPATAGYWKSSATASPNLYFGMVPTKAIGISSDFSEDGFETKFAYLVLQGFTNATTFGKGLASIASSKNYANDSASDRIIIKEKPASASIITNDAMFVIISYGANKSGGWNSNSTEQIAASSNSDEMENDADSPDSPLAGLADFDNIIFTSSANSSGFDDIIFYKKRQEMAQDFKLYNLLPCDSSFDEDLIFGSSSSYHWNPSEDVKYGEIAPSSTTCPSTYRGGPTYPAKKCGLFGNWETGAAKVCILGS